MARSDDSRTRCTLTKISTKQPSARCAHRWPHEPPKQSPNQPCYHDLRSSRRPPPRQANHTGARPYQPSIRRPVTKPGTSFRGNVPGTPSPFSPHARQHLTLAMFDFKLCSTLPGSEWRPAATQYMVRNASAMVRQAGGRHEERHSSHFGSQACHSTNNTIQTR